MALPKKGYKPGIYRFVEGTVDANGNFSITNIPKDGYVSGIYQITQVTIDENGDTDVVEDDIGITAAITVTVDGDGNLSITDIPEEGYVPGVYRVTTDTDIPKEGFNQVDFTAVIGSISNGKWESGPAIQFNASLTNSLIPSTAVDGTYTFSRADTDATVTDFEGLIKRVTANEARFVGARRVENLATGLVTETITVISGNEYQITINGGSGDTCVASGAFTGTLTANGTNRISWNSGTPQTATTTSLTLTVTGTLTEMLVEDVTGQTNQNPSENIIVGGEHGSNSGSVKYFNYENDNTVNGSGVVTEAQGSAISADTLKGVLIEEARTNQVVDSEDLSTQPVQGTPIVAVSSTPSPMAGVAAWDITDDNAAGFENVETVSLGTFSIGSTDTATATWFIAKASVPLTTHWAGLYLTFTGGTAIVSDIIFDNFDGTWVNEPGRDPYDSVEVIDYDTNWWKVITVSTNNGTGNTTGRGRMYPAVSTNGSTVSAAATGTNTFAIPQVEIGDFATSYIPTNGAAATRNTEALSYPNTNFTDAEGTVALGFIPNASTAQYTGGGDRSVVGVRGTNEDVLYVDSVSGETAVSDGTGTTTVTAMPSLVAGTSVKLAARWSLTTSLMDIGQDTVEDQVAFDGSMNKSTAMRLGYSGANRASGSIKSLRVYEGAVSDASFTNLTT